MCRTRCHSKKSCPCKFSAKPFLPTCHPGHTCTNTEVDHTRITSETISSPSTTATTRTQNWLVCGGISLQQTHKTIFQSTAWIDDEIITAAQNLLQQQYPAEGGLQSPILGQNFAMTPQTGEFVQVLNQSNAHWLTISTIGCEPSTVNIYDNGHGSLSSHSQKLVADIVQTQEKATRIQYIGPSTKVGAMIVGCLHWHLLHHSVLARTLQLSAMINFK